jgi:hypothetical protein
MLPPVKDRPFQGHLETPSLSPPERIFKFRRNALLMPIRDNGQFAAYENTPDSHLFFIGKSGVNLRAEIAPLT